MKYHPHAIEYLTLGRIPVWRQCQVGSLTGAVASQIVTEARNGPLSLDGNQADSVFAQAGLTVRVTTRAGAKAGVSDPAVMHGNAVA